MGRKKALWWGEMQLKEDWRVGGWRVSDERGGRNWTENGTRFGLDDEDSVGGGGGRRGVAAFAVRGNSRVVYESKLGSWRRTTGRTYAENGRRRGIGRKGCKELESATSGVVLCDSNAMPCSVDKAAH